MNTKSIGKSSWVGPTAQTLKRVYGKISPATLFIDKARQVFRDTRINGPAYDPFKYAEKLGIEVEEKKNLAIDGMLKCNAQGCFVVYLKKNVNKHRKNFTLAHEISHTFFYDLLTHPMSYRGNNCFDPEEERLCDIGAAELLMPESHFRSDLLIENEVTPQTLFWLVGRYQVSLQAVAKRASFVKRNLACVFWRREEGAIDVEWITPSYLRRFTLCQTGKSSVELALKTPGEAVTRSDSFYGTREEGGRILRETASFGFNPDRAISVINLGGI